MTYLGGWRLERTALDYQISYVRNISGGARNDGASYAAARLGAKRSWEALRFSGFGTHTFPNNWQLSVAIDGQYADEPLIAGEQFGLGGTGSVRGFEERAVTGDRGIRAGVELWTPPLPYDLRLLAFLDAGHLRTVEAPPGQVESETLVSLGLGLRWSWREHVNVVFDYGHEVNDARSPDAGGEKAHLSVFVRF